MQQKLELLLGFYSTLTQVNPGEKQNGNYTLSLGDETYEGIFGKT